MKKMLSVLLSIVILFSIITGVDFSAYASTGENLLYDVLGDGKARISGYTGSPINLTIPSTIDGYTITSIGESAFSECTSLKSVTIPDSVTSIDSYAFYNCTGLKSVTIPGSVKSIGQGAFFNCTGLTGITIPNGVTSISGSAFQSCTGLTNVTISESVTSIGEYAFEFCTSLTSVTIPKSITNISDSVFNSCTRLASVTIPDSVTSIDSFAFFRCTGLTSITIPKSVTNIGENAFYGCAGLTSVTIPENVTTIGERAFGSCTRLTGVSVSNNNPNYASNDGVLFNKDKTELIQYPTGNTRSTYTIPNSVKGISDFAFENCTGLTDVTISDSVTHIGNYTFQNCTGLKSVTILGRITKIGDSVFFSCTSLTDVTIPDSVTSIGFCAFGDLTSLTDIYYSGSEEEWKSITIESHNDYLRDVNIHYNSSLSACTTHQPGSAVKENVKNATCTTNGSYDSVVYCTVCNSELSRTTIPVKVDHTYKTTTTAATTSENGRIVTQCSECGTVKSETTIDYPKTITLSAKNYTYDGKTKTPTVKVVDSNGEIIGSSNYTVTYASGRKNVGEYAVNITFNGNYSGTTTLYFTIRPKATSISKVTAGSKKFTVKWKKETTQITGYQINYSTSSKFSKAKTVTVGKNSTTSKKISKLTAKKKYYVRVRTYKTVKINGKNTRIYSSWSKSKYIKTKK